MLGAPVEGGFMIWQLRAVVEDRPGALAALAQRCADHGMNFLALDVLPAMGGRVVDELVVSAPDAWAVADLESLCRAAGLQRFAVTASSVRDLEDLPVRYLRAAGAVVEDPSRVVNVVCELLDAELASASSSCDGVLDLDGVQLVREMPFTDTEWARAAELCRLATNASVPRHSLALPHPTSDEVSIRRATAADVEAVTAMHERCSADSLRRRYHAATGGLSHVRVARLVEPPGGICLVATAANDGGEVVVATGIAVVHETTGDIGLLVEDQFQRTGIGTRLLHSLAVAVRHAGVTELALDSRPDNRAVPAIVARAGFRARATFEHGRCRYRVQLPSQTPPRGQWAGSEAIGRSEPARAFRRQISPGGGR
jgi:GNAT superfamily N-acetyltransferase